MPLLSAGPVYSLKHSLEVWEVWVSFSCQPGDTSLHLPAVRRVSLVAGLGWGVASYLPAARAEPLLQQRPQVLETSRRTNEKGVLYCSPVAETTGSSTELQVVAPAFSKCVHFTGNRPWIITWNNSQPWLHFVTVPSWIYYCYQALSQHLS